MNIYIIIAIVSAVLALIFLFVSIFHSEDNMGIMMAITYLILFPTVFGGLGVYYEIGFDKYVEERIYSLRVDTGFTIRYGYGGSESYYYYYTKSDLGYEYKSICAEGTYIVLTDEIAPCIKEVKVAKDFNYHRVIYCPTETIVENFELY